MERESIFTDNINIPISSSHMVIEHNEVLFVHNVGFKGCLERYVWNKKGPFSG